MNEPNFGSDGWDYPEDDDFGGGGGGGSNVFRFMVPEPAKNPIQQGETATKRVLFLNSFPFAKLWEHSLFKVPGSGNARTAICLAKNKIDQRGCPLCNFEVSGKNLWPAFVGFFTVIDCGFVTFEDGKEKMHPIMGGSGENAKDYAFSKRMLPAKRGGDDKPGILRKLDDLSRRHGRDMMGTVWDTSRSGRLIESVGDDWTYVRRIDAKDYDRYLTSLGATQEQLDRLHKFGGYDSYNWEEVFKPFPTYEQLEAMTTKSGGQDGGNRGGFSNESEGAGYGGGGGGFNPDDDEIPF